MSHEILAHRAARAAIHQRRQGDKRPLRDLFRSSFSLLRYIHRCWEPTSLAAQG